MTNVPWSTTVLLAVLAICASVLAWKGILSSHMISGTIGLIVGYVVRQGFEQASAIRARRSEPEVAKFATEEIPTKPGKKVE